MSYRAPVQDFAGVRTWVQNEYADKGSERTPYEDGKPDRDRVLPLPSYTEGHGGGHPIGRTITVVKPEVFNVPSDSNEGNTYPYALSPKPMGLPLHQRTRTLAQSGEEYGHPYMNQGTILNQRRPMTASEVDDSEDSEDEEYEEGYDEGYDDGYEDAFDASEDSYGGVYFEEQIEDEEDSLSEDDTIYAEGYQDGYDEGYRQGLIDKHASSVPSGTDKTSDINWRFPKKRQRAQRGQAKLRAQRMYRRNRNRLKRKQRRYYRLNKRKILRYQKNRRKNPVRFQRRPFGGYSSEKKRSRDYRRTHRTAGVKSMETALPYYQVLLAYLRAAHFVHWTNHWQVKGTNFYGDHLLMDRLYNSVTEEIDGLAEKIVAMYGAEAVDPVAQISLVSQTIMGLVEEVKDPIQRASIIEECLQEVFAKMYDHLYEIDAMSLGMDDFIMATANAHESNVYLLRQRLRG